MSNHIDIGTDEPGTVPCVSCLLRVDDWEDTVDGPLCMQCAAEYDEAHPA